MSSDDFSVVTGAFSFTGRYIAHALRRRGVRVKTLTGHPQREDPFQGQVQAMPYSFDDSARLTRSLEGASVLYNTYWVRFARGRINHATAVRNTRTLVQAAKAAGVQRIVQVSVTNPSVNSPLPYFRGKALQEQAVISSGLSYGIVRPALIFGREDILLNNIAWSLRNFRLFTIFGSGQYRVQPAYAGDVAELIADIGESTENAVVDAVGPDIMAFEDMVRLLAERMDRRTRLVHMRPQLAHALSALVGLMKRDVALTRDEISGLMQEYLISSRPATCHTRLVDWLDENAGNLGLRYQSELDRHYR